MSKTNSKRSGVAPNTENGVNENDKYGKNLICEYSFWVYFMSNRLSVVGYGLMIVGAIISIFYIQTSSFFSIFLPNADFRVVGFFILLAGFLLNLVKE